MRERNKRVIEKNKIKREQETEIKDRGRKEKNIEKNQTERGGTVVCLRNYLESCFKILQLLQT